MAKHRAIPDSEQVKNLEYPSHYTSSWWLEENDQLLHALAATQTTVGFMTIKRCASLLAQRAFHRGHINPATTISWFIDTYVKGES